MAGKSLGEICVSLFARSYVDVSFIQLVGRVNVESFFFLFCF